MMENGNASFAFHFSDLFDIDNIGESRKRLSISKDISKFSFCIKHGAKTVHIYDYRFHDKHEYLHGIYVLQ